MNNFIDKVSFIWSVADLLRGPYRPNQYKDVMLSLTVLRRLDCVLEPTKDQVLARLKSLQGGVPWTIHVHLLYVQQVYWSSGTKGESPGCVKQ